MTPFAEGYSSGYRDEPLSSNPYLKGLNGDAALPWAMEWIRGYLEGARVGRDDVVEKRRSACR